MAKKPPLEILFQSDDFVAINKPAGLAAIPGRGETTCVLEQLALMLNLPWAGSADPRIRVCHRIDKDTSGVLAFAKHVNAQRHLSHQFQNNTVSKEYLAIVVGTPAGDEGVVEAPLAPHPTSPQRMCVSKHGRPAITAWRVEARYRGVALLRCFPKTGKTHQIRVHLKHAGTPLAIDPLYYQANGLMLSSFKRDYRPTRGQDEYPLIDRLTLHAESLTFLDMAGNTVKLIAPLPKDFRATLNQLARHAS